MLRHKHKGLMNRGFERLHPLDRVHNDPKVKRWHNESLNSKQTKYIQPITTKKERTKAVKKKVKQVVSDLKKLAKHKKTTSRNKKLEKALKKNSVEVDSVPVDKNGYIFIDLTKTQHKGVRVKFSRREGNKKRTVGLQIEA